MKKYLAIVGFVLLAVVGMTEASNRLGHKFIGTAEVIEACEATTGWTALSTDTTGIATDLDHVMGSNSLEFDKVDGAGNQKYGGIQKTITKPINLLAVVANGGSVGYSLNVSATTDIDYCFLRLGTSSSHYNEWRVADSNLSTGWNSLRFKVGEPNTSGATGNGMASTSIKFVSLGCMFNAETDALADLRVDHIAAYGGLHVETDPTSTGSIAVGIAAMVVDLAAIEVLLGTIDTDTGAMVTDLAAIEVLLGTIDSDTNTIQGDTTAIETAVEIIDDAYGVADDDDTGACHALQVASAQHTLTAAGWHTVSCTGNSCPILCGSNPTATASANGHFIKIPDGAGHRLKLAGTKCAYLAGNGVATGEICFTYEGL